MENIRNQLGGNLKRLRLKNELSQEKLGEISSLHRTYVSSIERGERNVSLENLAKLTRALGCSFNDLFEGIE